MTYEPELKLAFNKGYTPESFAKKVYHLHVRYPGDWNELYFRDYLIAHETVAKAYGQLKKKLFLQYQHDRDAYTKVKSKFIQKYTAKARNEFIGKYAI
jgi:GrpB-like predicted nucleotidyltransferase (UPF0157 family)